jgi:hypothetical protein
MLRALGTLLAATALSWLAVYAAVIAFGIAFKAQEELIAVMVIDVAFILALSAVFAVVLIARGRGRAVSITALVAAAVVVLGTVLLEALSLSGQPMIGLRRDLPFLIEMAIPALLAVLVHWALVRRHLNRRDAARARLAQPATG